ncbi:MAG: hypothetical protein J0L97_04455 [Alphaproteobacteria bacterium]|nr:hypothetical protein [Alphaproteobacteria bacterium]
MDTTNVFAQIRGSINTLFSKTGIDAKADKLGFNVIAPGNPYEEFVPQGGKSLQRYNKYISLELPQNVDYEEARRKLEALLPSRVHFVGHEMRLLGDDQEILENIREAARSVLEEA